LQALLPLPYVPQEKQSLLHPFKALLAAFFGSIIILVWQGSDQAHKIEVHFRVKPTIVEMTSLVNGNLQSLRHVSIPNQF